MDRLLSLASRRSVAAEVFRLRNVTTEVDFEDNKLKEIESHESSGLAMRVIKNGRLGFSTTTKCDNDVEVLERAISSTRFDTPVNFTFPSHQDKLARPEIFDSSLEKLPTRTFVTAGLAHIDAIRRIDRHAMAFSSFSKGITEVRIVNTAGLDRRYKKTTISYTFGVKLTKEKNFIYVYESGSGTHRPEDMMALSKRVASDFVLARKNVFLKSGDYPVIIAPSTLAIFLKFIMACVNGNAIFRNESPWKDSIGRHLFDRRISVFDDGTVPRAIGSAPFDDEGVPSQRTPIIENGVLHSFIHNLHTAGALGQKPTGNGIRATWLGKSITLLPSPAPSNVILKSGDTPLEQMQSSIREGLLIKEVMGAQMGNPYGGEIRGSILLGFKICRGEIVGRVKDAMLAVNVFDALKNQLFAISKETTWLYHMCLPYVMLDGVSIIVRS